MGQFELETRTVPSANNTDRQPPTLAQPSPSHIQIPLVRAEARRAVRGKTTRCSTLHSISWT